MAIIVSRINQMVLQSVEAKLICLVYGLFVLICLLYLESPLQCAYE
jgi:hypothetical protein